MKRILLVATLSIGMFGCNQKESAPAAQSTVQARANSPATDYVSQASGVWAAEQGGLITIDYRAGQLRFVIGDNAKLVKLGDVDVQNGTINFLLKRADDNKEVIWTLHRISDSNGAAFHQKLILDDGTQEDLSFVRAITADDINRLANLYSRQGAVGDMQSAAHQLATPSAPASSATPQPPSGPTAADAADVGTVKAFYAALASGDGIRAAGFVVPEKRESGAFAPEAMTRFYSNLSQPIQLQAATEARPGLVAIQYTYATAAGKICQTSAEVQVVSRSGQSFVQAIHGASC
jgi:hypothetical protein